MATPKPPAQDAPPDTVRAHFSTILTELHNVPEPDASSIASHWKYGRGSEISYYDIDTYRSIFGPEAGILLYGHARQELRIGKRGPSQGTGNAGRMPPKVDLFGQEPGAGLLKVLLLLTIGLGMSAMGTKNTDRAAGIGAIACISGLCFVFGYVAFYFG